MTRHLLHNGILACLLLAVSGLPASAQRYGQPGETHTWTANYNPYTGNVTHSQSVYNPYTGAGAASGHSYNTYTGTTRGGAAAYNPYTGTSRSRTASYNPLTGSMSTRRTIRR
jgi:hypothetical protein